MSAANDLVQGADLEVRTLAASMLVERLQLGRAMGITFNGKRDLGTALGYLEIILVGNYRNRYERGGIAGRIVEALPKATWRGGVSLIEDDNPQVNTAFEQAWETLQTRLNVVARLERADILSRLSNFSVLLLGSVGDVETELPVGSGPDSLLYLSAYVGTGGDMSQQQNRTASGALPTGLQLADARVARWDEDPSSVRFGQPTAYNLRRTSFQNADFSGKNVHWSRVIHLAEGCLDDDVFGQPALQRVWNNLDDLDKVVGGGAEAFFQRANQGRLWSIDKDIKSLTDGEKQDFRDQIEKFEHNITRDVRMRGVEVKELGSDVANFANQVDSILTLLAGATGIPKRILTGSEMGELASSQDRDNWRDQVNGRREQYATPFVLRRLVDRLIKYKYLPTPTQYKPRWGAVMNMTEEEKRAKALSWATTNRQQGTPVFLATEIREQCYEMAPLTPQQLDAEIALKPAPIASPFGAPTEPKIAQAALVDRLAQAIERGDTDEVNRIFDAN